MIKEEWSSFSEYELLDSGDGNRLERFGEYVLAKPDPAALWKKSLPESEWKKADAVFVRSGGERGAWKNSKVPEQWLMNYGSGASKISFYAKLSPFKHTGVFPEQVANWDFIHVYLKGEPVNILNLFGYTGISSVLCAKLGAFVTHVDASKPAMSWAKENMRASDLSDDSIRWILEDALKFVKREARRGKKYNAIIMDPPAFGRGAKGEVWKFNEQLPQLLKEITHIIDTDNFKFLIINAYAVSVSSLLLKNLLDDLAAEVGLQKPQIDYGELVLKENSGRLLSTGIFGRLY